jgi:hypothetical protein
MGLLAAIWMIVLGVLGAANLIIARNPKAKELIGKLAPYQGWIGAISALWGIWITIWMILNIGWIRLAFLLWLTVLAEGLLLLALGLLLGIGVLKTFVKQPKAVEKMDLMVTRLTPYQGTLGLVAIALGAWGLIASIVWRVA